MTNETNAPITAHRVTLASRVRVSPEVLLQEVGGESVLLDIASENYFGLNRVGTRIWRLLENGASLRAVCDTLFAEFDVPAERLECDMFALIGQLSDESAGTDSRSPLARWRALSWRDRRRLSVLMFLLPLIHLALALFRFQRVRDWLERHSRDSGSSNANSTSAGVARCAPAVLADAQRLAELASIAGRRGVVAASCLRQSLVVWWWLRRSGLAPQLRIGTLGSGETFAAHAWVELDGVALAQSDLKHRSFDGI